MLIVLSFFPVIGTPQSHIQAVHCAFQKGPSQNPQTLIGASCTTKFHTQQSTQRCHTPHLCQVGAGCEHIDAGGQDVEEDGRQDVLHRVGAPVDLLRDLTRLAACWLVGWLVGSVGWQVGRWVSWSLGGCEDLWHGAYLKAQAAQ